MNILTIREQPVFGPSREIFFRKVEANSAFLYSVREDGSGLRRVSESPLLALMSVHPNHKWLRARRSTRRSGNLPGDGRRAVLDTSCSAAVVEVDRGREISVCSWRGEPDVGQHLRRAAVSGRGPAWEYCTRQEFSIGSGAGKAAGSADHTVSSRHSARPDGDVYAFSRETVQRNLYRIPVP